MKNVSLDILKDKIVEFCQRCKITEFALFGSVLREDFRPDSDIDVLVTFAPQARYSLSDLVIIQDELREIFGCKVDLVEKAALRNPFRRHEILKNMETVYAN
jgi:hypothetical protein